MKVYLYRYLKKCIMLYLYMVMYTYIIMNNNIVEYVYSIVWIILMYVFEYNRFRI